MINHQDYQKRLVDLRQAIAKGLSSPISRKSIKMIIEEKRQVHSQSK
jgi:hypothetical protein